MRQTKNIILAAIAGAAFAALTACIIIDKNTVEYVADNTTVEETTETTKPQREVEKTAIIGINSKDGDYLGHAEGDYYVIDYCGLDDETITVPDKIEGLPVKKIGKLGFARRFCKKIILPDSVEEIGERAFINCELLESITVGKGLKKIGPEALKSCHALKEAAFPDGMSEIANNVFSENEELTRIIIPGKDTKIGDLLDVSTCGKALLMTSAGSQADKTAREKKLPVQNE